ncbi:MAG: LysR family transcriptional regulator [Candidatus Tokpelaia sp.]|uniref:LysR family transcriptional regulator n=1 Tax=Candidatus Tokpelaia sp. TaxID=2233777 RepID=UPI0012383EC8|nr:LysR family transcriptional regulator [Candidatus Tokpelaia sp.]KAA6205046.1 MAG: LysR family transcriptional regulator [Candidatus Tokpelaia sp.]KAA6207104.1 MAG: LysR family transcriptional regulator [Candidatus Tokpelaia sp.]KAA6406026.1 LysR family transcriptional regulator [Candidatus Tokpelaia sp.]
MARTNFNDIQAFIAVARDGSFTRAAARLGVTQSALSQTVANLEARLKIRLLARTTRSVAPTAAGEHLLTRLESHFTAIEEELDKAAAMQEKPAGTVRISCGDFALSTILLPKLAPLLRHYPDIKLEFNVNYGFVDIVAERYDAGIRFGETIDKDMIALPIGGAVRMAAAATPAYFAQYPIPRQPQDLTRHNCINMRFPTYGGLYIWEFERHKRIIKIRVDGQMICNTSPHIVEAALSGLGLAYLPEEEFAPHITEGRLVRVLEDWCPPFAGYHIYYPSRRQPSPTFALVLKALQAKIRLAADDKQQA